VIPKQKLNEVINKLISAYRVAAPVRKDNTLVFDVISDASEAVLNDEITYKSPKEFLFPQTEKILTFTRDGKSICHDEAVKTVIIGAHPCDLEAFNVLKAVFTQGKFLDTYVDNKIKNTYLVGLGCVNEKRGCFCSERGVDKGFSENCDLFLTDKGDVYSAEIVTEKGRQLLEGFDFEEDKTGREAAKAQDNLLEINADENTLFNKIDWAKYVEKCLGCGTCTYICPTCHCFGFRDTDENGDSVRYRCWDSCMYPKFTLHSSGHNPRTSKVERYRQRVLHKYLYIKENFGIVACTGCGRCIRSCPAGMNIKNVVEGIVNELKNV